MKARFGGIDVLEYSPAPHSPGPGLTLAALVAWGRFGPYSF
ncbi:hypothetical protein [Streptomyces sp. NBC_01235]|nr:hypothetical protein OG289_16955 [Streptomyces sp. NBC_01235]